MEEKQVTGNPDGLSVTAGSGTREAVYSYVSRLIEQAETILDSDPSCDEAVLFQMLAERIVRFFEAEIASIWLFDSSWQHLASFCSREGVFTYCHNGELFERSIAQEIVATRQPLTIPDIWKEDRWQNKEILREFGVNSALLVRVSPPRIFMQESAPEGVLQIFYREKDRPFSVLEIEIARLFSRRVSYVLARKKIKGFQKCNAIRNWIVEHVFSRLTKGEGVRMRGLFNSVIPYLSELMDIRRSALFSVDRQRREVVLEAGYPENAHGIGKTRSMDEPYFRKIIEQSGPFGEFEHERIYSNYIMITDPQRSRLVPEDIKYFLTTQNIRSVLYVPLRRGEEVHYFLTFDAEDNRAPFAEEEIEIILFFGMELVKGLRLETLHDLLHDSKNIGMSLTYFTRRIRDILRKEQYPENEKLNQAMKILLEESSRLQGLFLSLFDKGNEEVMDVTEIARRRFLFHQETVKEMKRDDVRFVQHEFITPLRVRCIPSHIERMIDNLLSNATSAVPDAGGEISIRTYKQNSRAVVEIVNTGWVSKEEMEQHLRGKDGERQSGRGLYICNQLANDMGGEIGVEVENGFVIIRVMLPLLET